MATRQHPREAPIKHVQAALRQGVTALEQLLHDAAAHAAIARAGTVFGDAFASGRRVYACGSGGSMSDAIHFAQELTGRLRGNRAGLAAQAISDIGHLSCVANDFGYDQVYARWVMSHGKAGDCLLAISTSGSSVNVLNAAMVARDLGMPVIALTGDAKSDLATLSDVVIAAPIGLDAGRVRELHVHVIHIIIELIAQRFFPENVSTLHEGRPAAR